MKHLLDEENADELHTRFGSRMEFGTAGLRAVMGAGISQMNDLTIIQTTQVLGSFCFSITNLIFTDIKKHKNLMNEQITGCFKL